MMLKLKNYPKWKKAYGPVYAKLFTRVEEAYNGGWVTQNGQLNIMSDVGGPDKKGRRRLLY
jgi:hypothetical protein